MTLRNAFLFATLLAASCNTPPSPTPTPSPTATPSPSPSPSTATATDNAIDGLVKRLSTSHGLWINGASPTLDTPKSATTKEVLGAMFARISFDRGRVTKFDVVEERDVTIAPGTETYHAVRLDTDQGKMVVLMRFGSSGWWTRAYQE